MSPELRSEFEARWPALAVRLDRFLANRSVSPCRRDDLIQETAIRLFGIWTTVDRTRSPWPLTVTIALNLLRDESRAARNRELFGDLPETEAAHQVEAAGLARIELGRVAAALEELPALQRAALMREIGVNGTSFTTREAEKMLRLRARKRLRSILERVSGILLLRPRRDPSDLNTVLMARDGLTQVATCFACAVLGIAAGVVPGIVSPPAASAAAPRGNAMAQQLTMTGHSAAAVTVPRAADASFAAAGSTDRTSVPTRTRTRTAPAGNTAPATQETQTQTVPGATPLPEDVPLEPPAVESPPVAPPTAEPPPLPAVPPVEPPQGDKPLLPGQVVEDALSKVSST